MTLLRCATHGVADLDAATERFAQWLDYRVVEEGVVAADLAAAWGAPASAGRRYAVCQPASGTEAFLRFVEGDTVPDYRPIRSHGWAAIEICVEDVLAVDARMREPDSPFPVIGSPTRIAGFPAIFPMQVRGPDQETVYFTQITDPLVPGLPRASSPIDAIFILVLACADLRTTAAWFAETLLLDVSSPVAIRYSMISQAFDLPITDLHPIATASWQGEVFLELDEYPASAGERIGYPGALPPGVSICTLIVPHFATLPVEWFSPPVVRPGRLYGGRRVGVLKTPEGALIEVIEGPPACVLAATC
ncbi:hypothetical protein [Sphingomonas sp. OK281]|uniref:hypothetical protein n=1 Tax=Sphingomonas sp. OK281 TaxID=1881067 RepID=UPI0008E5C9FE|nr:hypothetical protein [Sphingomonas sp. OK281]SFO02856.1 hypothetical protein SAMN05428984_1715 [Sphingomonas sp. OK281]